MTQVAISKSFLDSYANLPKKIQKKTSNFTVKFLADPKSPGINFEKINSKDGRIWSVRIDDTYRGIVMRDDASGIYMLLWVDHHDEAYEWASRKKVAVNPATGVLQIYEVVESQVEDKSLQNINKSSNSMVATKTGHLFSRLTDQDLSKLGVPEELNTYVRSLTEERFEKALNILPEDAYEALGWAAQGFPVSEVHELVFGEEVGRDDSLAGSLDLPGTMRSVIVVDGEEELQAMLDAPMELWRTFLHPTQRALVTKNFNGPARVLGGAGTGKTVVAMHRARWLASRKAESRTPNVFLTTFSKTLAADIRENMKSLCTTEELRRITIENLDAWMARFLKNNGFDFKLIYEENRLRQIWEDAMVDVNYSGSHEWGFFKDEWSQVLLPEAVRTGEPLSFSLYAHARRRGRGDRLSRQQRQDVWKVMDRYKELLQQRSLRDGDYAMLQCAQFIEREREAPLFTSIVVDEGQDFSACAYALLRAMAGHEHSNDLFIVGDSQQRIYAKVAALSRCGINIRGRSKRLRVNYRTTEEIRKQAIRVLENIEFDDLDGGVQTDEACQSLIHGEAPLFKGFSSRSDELNYVVDSLRELQDEGEDLKDVAVIAATNESLNEIERVLTKAGDQVQRLTSDQSDSSQKPGVRLATMHRIKGLEFNRLFITGLGSGAYPPYTSYSDGGDADKEAERTYRSLLYVALTRAKKDVVGTYVGIPSKLLNI